MPRFAARGRLKPTPTDQSICVVLARGFIRVHCVDCSLTALFLFRASFAVSLVRGAAEYEHSPAAHCRHKCYGGSVIRTRSQAAAITDVFFTDEDIDVLAYFSPFIQDAVAQARVLPPQCGEGFRNSHGARLDVHVTSPPGVLAQRAGDIKGNRHSSQTVTALTRVIAGTPSRICRQFCPSSRDP